MEYVLTGAFMDSTKVLDTVQNAVSDFKSGFQTPIIKNAGRKKNKIIPHTRPYPRHLSGRRVISELPLTTLS